MKKKYLPQSEQGFSFIELLIVILLISILTLVTFLGASSKTLYSADTQALAIVDILQEARQKALTQGKTLRVEVNDTKKQIRLIDENSTTPANDDVIIRASNFDSSVTVGAKPSNVDPANVPKVNSPIPEIKFTQTNYVLSANDKVQTLRFLKTGEVVDGGRDNLGTGALSSGVTIYVYNGSAGGSANVVRAVTLSGITAAVQLFKCQQNNQGTCSSWVK